MHTDAFIASGSNRPHPDDEHQDFYQPIRLSDLKEVFIESGKKFILRGCILCQRARHHYVTLIRCKNAWMYYDGTWGQGDCDSRFQFKSLNSIESDFNYGELSVVSYEVVNIDAVEKADPAWSEIFLCQNEYNEFVNGDPHEYSARQNDDMDEPVRKEKAEDKDPKIKKLLDELNKRHKQMKEEEEEKKRANKNKGKAKRGHSKKEERARKSNNEKGCATRTPRFPFGFSLQEHNQTKGQRPKCRGRKEE